MYVYIIYILLVEIRIVCPIKTCSQLSTNSQCSGNGRTYLTLTQNCLSLSFFLFLFSIYIYIYIYISFSLYRGNHRCSCTRGENHVTTLSVVERDACKIIFHFHATWILRKRLLYIFVISLTVVHNRIVTALCCYADGGGRRIKHVNSFAFFDVWFRRLINMKNRLLVILFINFFQHYSKN